MNRDQKRALEKAYRKSGKSKTDAKRIAQLAYDVDKIRIEGVGDPSRPKDFEEDDKFKIDIDKVKARTNYDRMNDNYKAFIGESADKVFTAHVERGNLISAKEEPKWLFWSGDLIKVE